MHRRQRIHRQRNIRRQISLQTLMQALERLRLFRDLAHVPIQRNEIRLLHRRQRAVRSPSQLLVHRSPNLQQTHHRVPIRASSSLVPPLVIVHDLSGGSLYCPALFIGRGLGHRPAQRGRETRHDGRVVPSQVVQLDRLGNAVIFN